MENIRVALATAVTKKVNNKDCKHCNHFSLDWVTGKPCCGYEPEISGVADECVLFDNEFYRTK